MEQDGDLDALYETPAFKEAQVVASQALYFLNWLHYYGARLYDGAQRKELLEKAQRGFSEFAVGDRRSELLVESLLGRGLTPSRARQYRVRRPRSAGGRERPASVAGAQVEGTAGVARRAGARRQRQLRRCASPTNCWAAASAAEDNVVRYLRIRALLAGVKKSSGAEAERYRQQAMAQMDQLRRAGPGWEEKVAALAQTSIDNPEKWADNANNPFARWEVAKMLVQKGDYKQAMPLLEELRKQHRRRRCASITARRSTFSVWRSSRPVSTRKPPTNSMRALKDENASYGADASYMRFKALETVIAKTPNAEVTRTV